MAKCIFNKKHTIKGYRKCEITGQMLKSDCNHWAQKNTCKYYKQSLFDRFLRRIGF